LGEEVENLKIISKMLKNIIYKRQVIAVKKLYVLDIIKMQYKYVVEG
jgi:hypothetical protein